MNKEQKKELKRILGIKEIPEEYKERQRRNSKFRRNLKKRATEAEVLLMAWFEKNGIRAIFQKGFLKPFHRIVDFYIPKYDLIVEVDGGYHMNTPKKDKIKDSLWLRKRGMRTIRIKNEEVYARSFPYLIFNYIKFYEKL